MRGNKQSEDLFCLRLEETHSAHGFLFDMLDRTEMIHTVNDCVTTIAVIHNLLDDCNPYRLISAGAIAMFSASKVFLSERRPSRASVFSSAPVSFRDLVSISL